MHAYWIFTLLLFGTVVCAASVPPVDDPDTPINESYFEVLVIPVFLSIKLVRVNGVNP
jgi:hypothetical protein